MLFEKGQDFSARDISYYATDGRLTAEPDGKRYHWNEMINRYRELGRTLTEEETEAFRVKQKEA